LVDESFLREDLGLVDFDIIMMSIELEQEYYIGEIALTNDECYEMKVYSDFVDKVVEKVQNL
jgi:hypothetical protein